MGKWHDAIKHLGLDKVPSWSDLIQPIELTSEMELTFWNEPLYRRLLEAQGLPVLPDPRILITSVDEGPRMTEEEWLTSSDPVAMLRRLVSGPGLKSGRAEPRPTDRKLRLFACGCCRQVWDRLTDERSRRAVEVAERYADGEATDGEREETYDAAIECSHDNEIQISCMRGAYTTCGPVPQESRRYLHGLVSTTTQAALLRCLVGNPFRPVYRDKVPVMEVVTKALTKAFGGEVEPLPDWGRWLAWDGGTVPAMAQAIYDERRWQDLPVLADALEEAGCTDADILGHCRGPGPHARGCWVLDLILGKG